MAVPPTDAEQLGTEESPGRRSYLGWIAAALGVVCVACIATLVVLLVTKVSGSPADRVSTLWDVGTSPQKQAADDNAERDAVTAVATQFVERVNTYGPHDLDKQGKMPGYESRVEQLMSAKFEAGFSKALTLAEQPVAKSGYARVAKLFSYGVASMDSDSADVLVAGDFTSSYPNPQAPNNVDKRIVFDPTGFRFDVSLVKIDGEWKVDDFMPVTGTDSTGVGSNTPGGQQSSSPSTTPSSPASARPSTRPSSRPSSVPSNQRSTGTTKAGRSGSRSAR